MKGLILAFVLGAIAMFFLLKWWHPLIVCYEYARPGVI